MSIWKKIVIVILVVIAIIVFAPYLNGTMKDGGSQVHGSVVYSVVKYHRLSNPDDSTEYEVGWGLEIFDQEIYKNTHIIHEQENDK